jgi:hypothetical protein
MKRFALYLLLLPLIAPPITAAYYAVRYGGNPFIDVLIWRAYFLLFSYINWLLPAFAIATADRLIRADGKYRLMTIAAVGCVSTWSAVIVLYGLPSRGWGWGHVWPGIIGAIAALLCCLLIDQLTKDNIRKVRSRACSALRFLRRWPHHVEE